MRRELVRAIQTKGPAMEPVGVEELRAEVRQMSTDQDSQLARYIATARSWMEATLSNAYLTQEFEGYLSRFQPIIRLPKSPLQSVSAIQYMDSDEQYQTVDASIYIVDPTHRPGRIYLKQGQRWPTIGVQNPLAVKIAFTVGFGDKRNDVPQEIRQAILILSATMYWTPTLTEDAGMNEAMEKIFNAYLSGHQVFNR